MLYPIELTGLVVEAYEQVSFCSFSGKSFDLTLRFSSQNCIQSPPGSLGYNFV